MTAATASLAHAFFAAHRATLETARATIRTRDYWSAYPEVPSGKMYGETAKADGEAAFRARLGTTFGLRQPGEAHAVAPERSPYGLALDIAYPTMPVDALIAAAQTALPGWIAAGVEARTGIALEMLARLNRASFTLANAVMHTTGQAFVMAFQAGGPHAQDRGLEAVAYAYDEMMRIPASVLWEKPQGKADALRIRKTFAIVPRGIALTIGCSTFPTWNAYPGIFASLVTGNAVIVKPHPNAILPLALTVEIMRETLREAGFDPNLVLLAVDTLDAPIAKELVAREEIAIVDYTGSSTFGAWLEANAHQQLYTEKGGVNTVVVDSTADYAGLLRNLALSVSLYAGQMCTTPRVIFVPRDGITTDAGPRTFDAFAHDLCAAIDELLAVPARALEILGAIASDATLARIEEEAAKPGVLRASGVLAHPHFPAARIRTPLVVRLDAAETARYDDEHFGPIVALVAAASTADAVERAGDLARRRGAITAIVHCTDDATLAAATHAAATAGVSLAINFTGSLLVNQSSAYSDYHVSGGNPSGNASLTDAAFVANRFRVFETRTPQ